MTIKTKFSVDDTVFVNRNGKVHGPYDVHHIHVCVGFYGGVNILYYLAGCGFSALHDEDLMSASEVKRII